MTTIDSLVVAGALAAIAWVNWYFFAAERRTDSHAQHDVPDRH